NTDPVNSVIRQLFMDRIIHAKGISRINSITDNDMVPTPYAVLRASVLLSDGCTDMSGLGCLMTVDAGGATTDVHSVCEGYGRDDVLYEGLTEPRVMRTVEGDIGVRWNVDTILGLLGDRGSGFGVFREAIHGAPSVVFGNEGVEFETVIASKAVETAVRRHCGTLEKQFTPRGARFVQKGKDLTGVKALVATGGPMAKSGNPIKILNDAFYKESEPESLRPENPDIYIDTEYIMASAGLLAEISEEKALIYMKKYLKKVDRG
ncbi:MAG: glutamate mutase L, partial [Clostridia bacterium]|nr:glutamate mutase L [Clostridia bacterium]